MANTKISALPNGNPAQSSDLIPVERSGANFAVTVASVVANGVTVTPTGIISNGLLAEYNFQDGTGTTLTDSTSNGYNGTLVQNGGLPSWIAGTGGLLFDGNTHQGKVTLPSQLNAAVTVQMVVEFQPNYTNGKVGSTYFADFQCLIAGNGTLANSAALYLENTNAASLTTPVVGGTSVNVGSSALGSFASSTRDPAIGRFVITWVMGASSDKFYINGVLMTNNSSAAGSLGAQTVGVYQLGGRAPIVASNVSWFAGNLFYTCLYNRALSAAEVLQNSNAIAALMTGRGSALYAGLNSPQPSLVIDGDSIQSSANGWPQYLTLNTDKGVFTPLFVNHSGDGTASLIAREPTCIDQAVNSSGHNVLAVQIGANQLGVTPGEKLFISQLAAYCQHARSKGYRVIVGTCYSQTGKDTYKNTFNGITRQNWPMFADALVDLAAAPLIGADGASADTTYFTGGIHLTAAGQQIAAPIWQRAINRLMGNLTYTQANTYTASATQVDADVFAILGASAGSQTYTLQTAQGYTGQRITIRNIDTNSWTIAADGSEKFDGASTVSLAAGKTLVVESVLASASAGGANWTVIQNG